MPKASSPPARLRARAGHVVEHPGQLGAGEIGVDAPARCAAERVLRSPAAFSASQRSAVRRSCQTMALQTGCAGRAVPDDGRFALVGDADGGDVARRSCRPAAMASAATAICDAQISSGSCSTQPGCGKICGNSRWATAATAPPWSKRMARELVVPWSRARMLGTVRLLERVRGGRGGKRQQATILRDILCARCVALRTQQEKLICREGPCVRCWPSFSAPSC